MTGKKQHCLAASFTLSISAALALTPAVVFAQGPFARLSGFFGGNPAYPQQMPTQNFVVTDQPRSSEIAVELAWLSDPMTFPYALTARNTGNGLQVQGFVPNEGIRQRALFLAKKNTTLPVYDGTRVHAGLPAPQATPTPNLGGAASEAVRSAMPTQAQHLRLSCGNNGSIAVVGTVGSYEEKLAVSQTLRQVPGCTSVANMVQVSGASYGQPSYPQASNPQPNYPPPGYAPHPGYPQQAASDPYVAPRPTGQSYFKNALAFLGIGPSPVPQTQHHMVDQNRPAGPTPNMMAGTGQMQHNTFSPGGDYVSPYHSAPANAERAAESNWRTSPPQTREAMTAPANHSVQVTSGQEYRGQTRTSQAGEPPLHNGGPQVIARSGDSGSPRRAAEPPLFGGTDNSPPIQEQTPPQPTPLPQPTPVNSGATPKLSAPQLKQRIEKLCGGSARNVGVEQERSGKLTIRMQIIDAAREQELLGRIVSMPELTPYQEQLQFSLEVPPPTGGQPQIVDEGPVQRR